MTKTYLLPILLLLTVQLYGQNDSIRNEILNHSKSKSEIITKGRQLLLDEFLAGDIYKAQKLATYLTEEVENNDYVALYPMEHWFILYWIQDYSTLLEKINDNDILKPLTFHGKILPANDMLYAKLLDRSRQSKEEIESFISHSKLSNIDKEFLSLNFLYLLAGNDYPDISQGLLNNLADVFLEKYPKNKYEHYTKRYIRFKLVPSNWGFAFEFFSGYGFFTKDLPDNYKYNVPIGIAFDIEYKKISFYLRNYIGFSKTVKDRPYSNGVWKEGSQVRIFLPEASVGYRVIDNKQFKIAPFVGISSTSIVPTEHDKDLDPALEDFELSFTTTYTAGINLDIKLGETKMPMISYNQPEQSNWFLRIRYAFNSPQFKKKYTGFDGNMHYITIGFGGFGRRVKREY